MWQVLVRLARKSLMSTVADLVNFLYYMGEPIRARRQEIGIWVLAFLAVLYVLTMLLGREFSKDYH